MRGTSRTGPTLMLAGLWDEDAAPQPFPCEVTGFLAAIPPHLPQDHKLARRAATLATSIALHGVAGIVVVTLMSASFPKARTPAPSVIPAIAPRMVFVVAPGPGGGGGGGGRRQVSPPSRAHATGRDHATLRVVQPLAPAVKPIDVPPPPHQVAVDAAPLASGAVLQLGVPDAPASRAFSLGSGTGSGVGDGEGGGIGSGRGSGWGQGSGGGTGGGVYRLGSGVTAPVLLTSVRPRYTPDALRDKIEGSVQLDVVVSHDGTVGAVRVVRSIDSHGLDQEAIAAVRQWRFSPGRLGGTPVDVLVTAMVEFRIR